MPARPSSIRLFQFSGIEVFLHWSWFLVAIYEINLRSNAYSSVVWNGVEYFMLFAIVTLHEFGHSLACRQVGGRADRIVLWPLGGMAIVDPPPRPGANLWSIAAGPLVNVVLLPVFWALTLLSSSTGFAMSAPDLHTLLQEGIKINIGLLLFNLLPIFPLDGGQILRSLLWYAVGRAQSLVAASTIGFVGVAALGLLAFVGGSLWIGVIALFAALQCFGGIAYGRMLNRLAIAARREGYACPSCKSAAPKGIFWACDSCHRLFDAFESPRWAPQTFGQSTSLGLNLSLDDQPPPTPLTDRAKCPGCGVLSTELKCPDCGQTSDYTDWKRDAELPVEPEQPLGGHPEKRHPVASLVLGGLATLIAVPFLLVAIVLSLAWREGVALVPVYSAQIERLWAQEGISIPGEASIGLWAGVFYDAYLETSVSRAGGVELDAIVVVNPRSGEQLEVTSREAVDGEKFRHDDRQLVPKASFQVPEDGVYLIVAVASGTSVPDGRLKVGPSAVYANGSRAAFFGGLAIGASIISLIALVGAFLLFRNSYRRRRSLSRSGL